jgi:superfamily I DNA/RNA helicase
VGNFQPILLGILTPFSTHHLPFYWVTENGLTKRNFDRNEDTIKISTIDSAKGLDFRVVFIVSIENMPFPLEEVEEREVSLFYIGMTRALEWLYLTYSGTSKFTKYLDEVLAKREEKQDNSNKKMGS